MKFLMVQNIVSKKFEWVNLAQVRFIQINRPGTSVRMTFSNGDKIDVEIPPTDELLKLGLGALMGSGDYTDGNSDWVEDAP